MGVGVMANCGIGIGGMVGYGEERESEVKEALVFSQRKIRGSGMSDARYNEAEDAADTVLLLLLF